MSFVTPVLLDWAQKAELAIRENEIVAHEVNPLCGDEISVALSFQSEVINEIRMKTVGCVILRASSHLIGEKLLGISVQEAYKFIKTFENSFGIEMSELDQIPIPELVSIYRIPNRYRCALLPVKAITNFLSQSRCESI